MDSILDSVIEKACGADLVGIGEHKHGDLTSWKFRLPLIEGLLKCNVRLMVFCENLECYVQDMNRRDRKGDVRFRILEEWGSFDPHLLPSADQTNEHLEITRHLGALKGVEFRGIDVQIMDFPLLWSLMRSRLLKKIMNKYRDEWELHSQNRATRGHTRNRLNARIILDLIAAARARKGRRTMFVYLAHNEHVATSSHLMRKDPAYKVDGYLLNQSHLKYLSIGTYTPVQYSRNGRPKGEKSNLYRNQRNIKPIALLIKGQGENVGVLTRHAQPSMNLGEYWSDDFDYVLCESRGAKPTLLVS